MAEDEREQWTLPGAVRFDGSGAPYLSGGKCSGCGRRMFPKGRVCPDCWSEDIADVALPTRGTLYSYAVVHVARKGWKTPYVIGYVDLAEDIRVSTPLAVSPDAVPEPDTAMVLVAGQIGKTDDGRAIMSHLFKPAE